MLKNQGRKITLTEQSVVTITEGGMTREMVIEGYNCTIESDKPEKMTVSRFYPTKEAEAAYADHKKECRADYAAFQEQAYALQDEMFEAQNSEA